MYFAQTLSRICLRYCFETCQKTTTMTNTFFTNKRLLITTSRIFRFLCIEKVIKKVRGYNFKDKTQENFIFLLFLIYTKLKNSQNTIFNNTVNLFLASYRQTIFWSI